MNDFVLDMDTRSLLRCKARLLPALDHLVSADKTSQEQVGLNGGAQKFHLEYSGCQMVRADVPSVKLDR